jgi:hypothetical protein
MIKHSCQTHMNNEHNLFIFFSYVSLSHSVQTSSVENREIFNFIFYPGVTAFLQKCAHNIQIRTFSVAMLCIILKLSREARSCLQSSLGNSSQPEIWNKWVDFNYFYIFILAFGSLT